MKPSFSSDFSDPTPGPSFGLTPAPGRRAHRYFEFETLACRAKWLTDRRFSKAAGLALTRECAIPKPKKKNRKLKLPVLTTPQLVFPDRETTQWPLNAVDPGCAINFG